MASASATRVHDLRGLGVHRNHKSRLVGEIVSPQAAKRLLLKLRVAGVDCLFPLQLLQLIFSIAVLLVFTLRLL